MTTDLSLSIAEARRTLLSPGGTDDVRWRDEDIASWLKALDGIERRVAGEQSERAFSIVRSLDSGPGTEGAKSSALMNLAAALRHAGFNDYR